MPDIPSVPWRFGERYLATDFVQMNNIAVREQANELASTDPLRNQDTFIEQVARWIRDNFFYPLDNAGNPAAQGQLLRHRKGLVTGYHAKKCVYYAWSLPNEILGFSYCGICIDTANLAGSVLRAGGIDAWVILGDVNSAKNGTLIGRHAWVETPYSGKVYVLETTIHDPDTVNTIEASEVYDKTSDWAKKSGIYFIVQAKYNENEFKGEGPLGAGFVELMGLPAHRVLLMGREQTLHIRTAKLQKEWCSEERLKTRLLKEAYGRM